MDINATFWHRTHGYFICIKPRSIVVDHCTKYEQNQPNAWYLIPNIMNKIKFFLEVSQKT